MGVFISFYLNYYFLNNYVHLAQYTDTWTCHLHKESGITTHTDIATTPSSRHRSKLLPTTHSPHTPPTLPQHKQTNTDTRPTLPIPHRIGKAQNNPLIHSPPTPTRAKHIHISHTSPTPVISRSTPLHSTSAAIPVYHQHAQHSPQPHLPNHHISISVTLAPSHSQHTHKQHKQQYI